MNSTKKALLKRGFNTTTIDVILNQNLTIKNLQLLNDERLIELGCSDREIKILHDENRPPIPDEIFTKLMYRCKATCNICRNSEYGIVIHHISPWHISHSHDIDNLIVLCPNDHDKVHTNHELTTNWTSERLIRVKKEWEAEVEKQTSDWLREKHQLTGNRWDYYNIKRLFELFDNEGIVGNEKYYKYLLSMDILTDRYTLNSPSCWHTQSKPDYCLFHPMETMALNRYISDLVDKFLCNVVVKDFNKLLEENLIFSELKVGDIITYTGDLYIKNKQYQIVENQPRDVHWKKKKIKVTSEINAFWATSSSAHNCFLTGHTSNTYLGLVKNVNRNIFGGNISLSTLCIGNNFTNNTQL